ncbi:MAG: radical SAM/SPASM domain-containing protein [Flavisolibacter sp.]
MKWPQSLYQRFRRYQTLQTHRITSLPVAILMPHSACNCRCLMCDIWKGNHQLKQLSENDIESLLVSFRALGTKQVVLSGGEALLHPVFFRFCELLRNQDLHVTLLSTGLLLKKHADSLLRLVNDVIVSLDGEEETHDAIRNIKGAFSLLKEGVKTLKSLDPSYRVTSRTVIHRHNFRKWPGIIQAAKEMGLDQTSFLPADVSSTAFNRDILWNAERQMDIALHEEELVELEQVIDHLLETYHVDFDRRFIAESPGKIWKIWTYYRALLGLDDFPYKKCNAPWVSTVIEADGQVKPCFFHETIGNIHEKGLTDILNDKKGLQFRKALNMEANETCKRCVCSLNLPAWADPLKQNHR